jgi:phage N-6-adenine-methyltransferase
MYSHNTIPTSQSTTTSELSTLQEDNTIASGEGSHVPEQAMLATEQDWLTQNRVCGGKCSELSLNADPALLLSRIQKACSTEEVEKYLPLSEWQDIVAKTRSCYRQRKSELSTKETEYSSLLSFRTLHSSDTSTNSKPAGLTKCEQSLTKLGIISPSHYLSARGMELLFGFPLHWTECLANPSLLKTLEPKAEPKAESKLDTNSLKPLCPDKLTSLSNEYNNLPDASVLLISSTSDYHGIALSGLAISFGKTLQYLPDKTVTRRTWKDSHAQKFINAFKQHKLVKALDKDIRYGGKQIGWCRLVCAPYKEQLSAMPDGDLAAEGGMCSSVQEFIQQYFKGDSNLEVWVIRFQFIATLEVLDLEPAAVLDLPADFQSMVDSNYPIPSPIESIHQTPLTVFGVYSDSDKEANNNPSIPLPIESIHQAPSAEYQTILGVYPISQPHQSEQLALTQGTTAKSKGQSAKKNTDCWYTPSELVELVLQTLEFIDLDPCADNRKHLPAKAHYTVADDGLTREWAGKVFMNPPYSCPGKWIAKLQAEFDSGRVTEAIALVPAATDTKWLSPLLSTQAICFWKGRIKFLDTDYQPKLPARQSHVLVYWGAEPAKFKEVFQERGTIFIPEVTLSHCLLSTQDAIEPGDVLNTNPAIPSATESIHQAPLIQGGNGLVYTFWKGESLVNHYRYKVKVNGKWKVRSVYIPVGKLPKVREAIANNLGVERIVVEILSGQL